MQTANVVDENIKRIGELFPNCLTERLDENGRSEVAIDFDQLRQSIDDREDCGKASPLDLNGLPFAAFIVPGLNASGCATLLDGTTLTFLFTPQDNTDYMLTAAEIMASFRN